MIEKHGLAGNRKINIQNPVYFTPLNILIIILEIIILCGIIIYRDANTISGGRI